MSNLRKKLTIGWKEWGALPLLNIIVLKMKVDTGARTSALHAFDIKTKKKKGVESLHFKVRPLERRDDIIISCEAPLIDERIVMDSGGHQELRPVIKTPLVLGPHVFEIEITLTDRKEMSSRMLLGRSAIRGLFLVDAAKNFLMGIHPEQEKYLLRTKK